MTLCFAKWGDESKFVCTLDDNLKRFNLSYLNIGENFDPTNFSYDESRVRKPHLLHENLNEITTKYIMGWDVDIFFTDHPNRVVERFENEFDCEWLFNAENTCFPMTRPRRQAMGLYRKWKEHGDIVGESPFKYLNSDCLLQRLISSEKFLKI